MTTPIAIPGEIELEASEATSDVLSNYVDFQDAHEEGKLAVAIVRAIAPILRNAFTAPEAIDADPEAVHGWFGLSYSNYLVLPRTLMQSMPAAWQGRIVALLEEMQAAYAHIEHPSYEVRAGSWAYPNELSVEQLKALGWSRNDPAADDAEHDPADDDRTVYYDPSGNEHDGDLPVVFVPGTDPVPHYNRGRTRVEPVLPEPEPTDPEAMREAASRLLTAANEAEAGR